MREGVGAGWTNQVYLCVRDSYGDAVLKLPLPEVDLRGFIEGIDMLNQKEPKVWSPAHRVLRDWVDIKALNYTYGVGVGAVAGYCCTMM